VKREEIVRGDFPASRKGYDREAVDAHLRRLADEVERLERRSGGAGSLAGTAGEKVASVIRAAEETAAELEREARERADEIVANARSEAREQVERAQAAVAGLVSQADELRERVGALGRDLGSDVGAETEPATVPEPTVPQPEVDPNPVVVPEPEPPREPLPEPDPVPEPQPPEPSEPPAPAAAGNGDEAGARLVAMKMALDGSSREEVRRHLTEAYGLAEADELLDDVFARVGR
jgi:DivIVA domain-containing protein